MEAAHNYENSAQSLRKAVRRSEKKDKGKGKKEDRKERRRRKFSDLDSDSESSDSDESGSASSRSEEERSPSPPRWSHRSKGGREKAIVKTEDPKQRRMMKSIEDTLEAIKVNLAENRKPRRTIPTSRMNVWCARCGDPGHYASECQRPTPKRVHFRADQM
jgi:hypothetical protein